jgi:hypothetical protein
MELGKLMLDSHNLRLAELGISSTASQFDLLKALWEGMAVEEVVVRMLDLCLLLECVVPT